MLAIPITVAIVVVIVIEVEAAVMVKEVVIDTVAVIVSWWK